MENCHFYVSFQGCKSGYVIDPNFLGRHKDPAAIKWGESGAEYVCESTGAAVKG